MSDLDPIMHRENGSLILPSDPDALRVLERPGILAVVQESGDELEVVYRMIDPDAVRQALDELGA